MSTVKLGNAVDGVDWPARVGRMLEIWLVINAIVVALAGLRGMQHDRREREFWRVYGEEKVRSGTAAGPWMKGQGS